MADRELTGPSAPFRASVQPPGDKSLSHRALILAAMASGTSRVTGLGPGLDVASTAAAVQRLGVAVEGDIVRSPGVEGWVASEVPIDCGNSGTTMRLLTGALAGRPFTTTLVGDESLSRRPMERVALPLRALGATVETAHDGTAPVRVTGGRLRGTELGIAIPTAQVRSAFELAAIQAEGASAIESPPGFRDHTERILESFGLGVRSTVTRFDVHPGSVPASEYSIPGDTSSAAFLWAAAAMIPGAVVSTPRVSLNPGRLGFLAVLERMGANLEAAVTGSFHGDPIGDVTVTGGHLVGTEVTGDLAAAAIDELPLVAVLGTCAEGITTVRDAAELRSKESDRIEATVALIRALGGGAESSSDGFSVVGAGFLDPGVVEARGDHRIAMAGAVAATIVNGTVTIRGAQAADVSWPGFFPTLEDVWSSR